jgi:phosphoribosylanthranilate isomerase
MKIKVCGITQLEQFKQVDQLGADYVGFIFYPASKRYVGECKFNTAELLRLQTKAKAVGVFVNPTTEEVNLALQQMPNIRTLQLHGTEDTMFCKYWQKKYTVIKAISVTNVSDLLKQTHYYKNCCDYFLLDTATPQHGGSGEQFDWTMLKNTIINKPFFLSGGIGLADVNAIKKFSHPAFFGVDVNSKLETKPGIKNMNVVEDFIQQINTKS